MSRTLSALVLLLAAAACEHEPPPKKQARPVATADTPPAPPPSEPAGSAAVAAPPAPVLVDAGVAPPPPDALETTAECNAVGVHLAKTIIDEATDPAQKAALEQERARIVRRTAEACTRDNWPAASRACFLKAANTADMQVCGRELAAPRE